MQDACQLDSIREAAPATAFLDSRAYAPRRAAAARPLERYAGRRCPRGTRACAGRAGYRYADNRPDQDARAEYAHSRAERDARSGNSDASSEPDGDSLTYAAAETGAHATADGDASPDPACLGTGAAPDPAVERARRICRAARRCRALGLLHDRQTAGG